MILEHKNIPVFYTDQGSGRAVVLLHGFLETASIWKDVVELVEHRHRIITIDLLGHGQTGCLGYIHTMEMMAEAVISVLDHLKVENFFAIGHSMGGYVALALAEAYPKRIEGLCLMNSTPFADSHDRQTNRDRAIRAVKHNPLTFIRMSIANLFDPHNKIQFTDEIESIMLEAMALPVQGIVAALEGMKVRKDRSKVLTELKVPKLAILGRHDPVLDYDTLRPQLEALHIMIAPMDGGHMSYIETKKEITYIFSHFIEK